VPTISANGGAERYWRHRWNGSRLVLCRNGRLLLLPRDKRSWIDANLVVKTDPDDGSWRADTSPRASASVTRTHRIARRGG
jgi:hypothetical protein